MLKSLCIKTNDSSAIEAILVEIEKANLNNLYIFQKNFSKYENLIFHYAYSKTKGNVKEFVNTLSHALARAIIELYEKELLFNIINENYFYFYSSERQDILNICLNELSSASHVASIAKPLSEYISEHRSIILDGFVRFRLYNYMSILDDIVDYSVNRYLIQREYLEFVRLLKEYVSTSESRCARVHLIYSNNNVTLMNDNNIIIPITSNLSDVKFISDISFSQNDYCLNTLLTILPSEIVLHVLSQEDEFIETVKLVFADRITICHSCEFCTQNSHKL